MLIPTYLYIVSAILCIVGSIVIPTKRGTSLFLYFQNIDKKDEGQWDIPRWKSYTSKYLLLMAILFIACPLLERDGHSNWVNVVNILLLLVTMVALGQRRRFHKDSDK